MRTIEGQLAIRDARFCVISARFNEAIVDRLTDGAITTLQRLGVEAGEIHLLRVPGAFELPLAAQRAASTRQYYAIFALAAVIRGATPHFDYVSGQCAAGLSRVSLDADIPVSFGVLTCDSIEQALERAGTKAGNKGADAAMSAIEMVDLMRQLG